MERISVGDVVETMLGQSENDYKTWYGTDYTIHCELEMKHTHPLSTPQRQQVEERFGSELFDLIRIRRDKFHQPVAKPIKEFCE